VKHASQAIAAQNRSGLRGFGRVEVPRRALLQPLMRPGLLVVLDELPQHALQMPAPEDQQMVEDLAPGCPDPPLGVCISLEAIGEAGGSPPRLAEDLIEAGSELGVPVAEQEAGSHLSVLE
jgi:hypothetical protein